MFIDLSMVEFEGIPLFGTSGKIGDAYSFVLVCREADRKNWQSSARNLSRLISTTVFASHHCTIEQVQNLKLNRLAQV